MQLAEMGQGLPRSEPEGAGAARVVPVRRPGHDPRPLRRQAAGVERGGDVGLGVERVDIARPVAPAAGERGAGANAAGDLALPLCGVVAVHRSQLEQGDAGRAAIVIAPGGQGQIGQQARPHRVEAAADRVGEHEPLVDAAEQLDRVAGGEREGHRLDQSARRQGAAHRGAPTLRRRQHRTRDGAGPGHRPRRNRVVALDPHHLLDEIGLAVDIGAPGGHGDPQLAVAAAGRRESQRREDALDLLARDLDAGQALHAVGLQRHLAAPVGHRAGDDEVAGFAAAQLEHGACRQLHAGGHEVGIDPALEAVARVALDLQLAAGRGGADRVEQGGLDEHVGRRAGAARGLAADHAAEAEHAGIVGDDGDGVVGRVFAAVERQELLAPGRQPDMDVAGDLVGIEHVQRTSDIEGIEVGHVDERGDRAQADRGEPVLQPLRAGPVRHAADIAADEQRARGRLDPLGEEHDIDGAGEGAGDRLDGQRPERSHPRRGEVPGDAVDAEAILAIGRDAEVDDRIVAAEDLRKRHAEGRVRGQLDDALMLVGEARFALRAQHAVGFLAADAGLLQVQAGAGEGGAGGGEGSDHAGARIGRAAHHLDPLAAVVDDAELEPVGVGVGPRLDHAGADEGGERGRPVDDRLDLEADRGQALGDLLEARLGVEMPLEPAEGELHSVNPSASDGTSSGRKPKCRSQRRSLSKNARRSGMPYFSIARRSIPMPKAKP